MLQIGQRPLSAAGGDAALFVGRAAELAKLQRAVRLGFNVLLLGQRGSGRTSLLRRLERSAAGTVAVHFVEASSAETVGDLVGAIRRTVQGPRTGAGVPDNQELRSLGDNVSGHPLVIVDGSDDVELVHRLFGRLRDEVWELPFRWIVSGEASHRSGYLTPPADAFFDVVVELPELSVDEAADLLHRRLATGTGRDVAALRRVVPEIVDHARPRTPRAVLAGARTALLSGEGPARSVQSLARVEQEAARLGRAPAMLMAELEDLGPVSASDPQLLERLGWTRSRAAAVLHQLEERGLVVAHDERHANRSGRPRRVYRINLEGGAA